MEFRPSPSLSLGVEVEVQLIDPDTMGLAPAAPALLAALDDSEVFKPEFYQTMLEMCTGVCPDVATAEAELREAGERLQEAAESMGVWICGGGTHPFSSGGLEHVGENPRYRAMLQRNQWMSRELIFGLHVHVGARSGDHAIELMNALSPYLAYLVGLGACSPFLGGQDTGLAAVRPTISEAKPTSGPAPALGSWAEFVALADGLKHAGAITSHKELHWDVRPSPNFGTLEVRICDQQLTLSDSLALTAVIHWLFGWLDERLARGERFAPTPMWRLRENKWRALRFGMNTDVIVDDAGGTAPLRDVWRGLLRELEPVAWRMGSVDYLPAVERLLQRPGYARQRDLVGRSKSLKMVVQALTEIWREDVFGVLSAAKSNIWETQIEGVQYRDSQFRPEFSHHAHGPFRPHSPWVQLPRAAGSEG